MPKPPRLPWKDLSAPGGILEGLVRKETREEAKRIAERLKGLPPEKQIPILAELDPDTFRALLEFYRPVDWIVERIVGRMRRLGGR